MPINIHQGVQHVRCFWSIDQKVEWKVDPEDIPDAEKVVVVGTRVVEEGIFAGEIGWHEHHVVQPGIEYFLVRLVRPSTWIFPNSAAHAVRAFAAIWSKSQSGVSFSRFFRACSTLTTERPTFEIIASTRYV